MRKQSSINNFVKRGGTVEPPISSNKGYFQSMKKDHHEDDFDSNPAVKKSSRRLPDHLMNLSNTMNRQPSSSFNDNGFKRFSKSETKDEDDGRPEVDLTKTYKLSTSQKKVLDAIMSRRSVFFTGAAGTGKSYVVQILRTVIEALQWEDKIAYTAPTGVAACNIRGLTIHSWAGVGKASEPIEQLLPIVLRNSNACKRWRETEILVIDEISMLSSELFEKLDVIGRRVRNNINPFGGLQIIVCGDFFQLPPVGLGKSVKFCFEADVWKEMFESGRHDGMILLDKVFRQQDDTTFLNLLNEMREGAISPRNQQLLQQKVQEAQQQVLLENQQHSAQPNSTFMTASSMTASGRRNATPKLKDKLAVRPTKLFSTNQDVDQYNMNELERLQQDPDEDGQKDPIIYFAVDQGKEPHLTQIKSGTKAPEKLYLKKGAQVMLLKNLDTERGLVNGSRGTVIDFERSAGRTAFCSMLPVVNFSVIVGTERREERVLLTPETWEVKLGESVLASRQQIPLMLAWAISIHKSQGMTIPWLEVSFNRMFEYGQAYVALSRATSLQGLTLHSFQAHAIRAHPMVKEFYRKIATSQQQEYGPLSSTTAATDEVLEVSLGRFVELFRTDYDSKQVNYDDWMETKPRVNASSASSSAAAATSTSNTSRTNITIPSNTQHQSHNNHNSNFDSNSSNYGNSTTNHKHGEESNFTSSQISGIKRPSMLFNSQLSSTSTNSTASSNNQVYMNNQRNLQNTGGTGGRNEFEDFRRNNAFGDEWLHDDFMARKRAQSAQYIATLQQQQQQQTSDSSKTSDNYINNVANSSSGCNHSSVHVQAMVDTFTPRSGTQPFVPSQQTSTQPSTNNTAPAAFPSANTNYNSNYHDNNNSFKNHNHSSYTSSAPSSMTKNKDNHSEVVDLVDSEDEQPVIQNSSNINHSNLKNSYTSSNSISNNKQLLQQSQFRPSLVSDSVGHSDDYGGYGSSPHLTENHRPLDRILSQQSSRPPSSSEQQQVPNSGRLDAAIGRSTQSSTTTAAYSSGDSTHNGSIIMNDSLKRKLEENRLKALEKLSMFKKSRLNESANA